MVDLARRFELEREALEGRIEEAETFYTTLATDSGGRVEIFRFPRALVYTFYQFDNYVVFATYKHARGKGGRLAMLVGARGGELYDWVDHECEIMIAESTRI